ncbi:MAG: hypothetical protein JRH15_20810 [Deltaproteobacteria bacterium]|nr:hypothetical protein [Deltaproteobacteria bacterium]
MIKRLYKSFLTVIGLLLIALAVVYLIDTPFTKTLRSRLRNINNTYFKTEGWPSDQVNKLLGKVNSYKPLLLEAGYDISHVGIEMGLAPTVILFVSKFESISPEKQRLVLEKYQDDEFFTMILQMLHNVNEVDLSGYQIQQTRIFFTIPPKMLVILQPIDDMGMSIEMGKMIDTY